MAILAMALSSCSDFMSPVKSTPTPTEYEMNYWLLDRTYLFEDELGKLDAHGDSVQELYSSLSDPYTRYIAPSKSESTIQHLNTSIVNGDIGLEYMYDLEAEHVLFIYQVYPKSPAARAKVPRYGNILRINGVEIKSYEDKSIYDSIMDHTKDITLEIAYEGDTSKYKMQKETVYAPTVFIDTLHSLTYIKIREFKLTTLDQQDGTYGELRSYLDSTRKENSTVRILDLRNNPGGHVNQCINMADLFVKKGPLTTRHRRTFNADGVATHYRNPYKAKQGDPGEDGKFMILVNNNSASCAEIFAAAVSGQTSIRVVGQKTYGKGIGQTTWSTMAGGLAIITNTEFLPPSGVSYHKIGIEPDYPCTTGTWSGCVEDAVEKEFGKKKKKSSNILDAMTIIPKKATTSGALFESTDKLPIF